MEFRIPDDYKDLIVKDELENFKELLLSWLGNRSEERRVGKECRL